MPMRQKNITRIILIGSVVIIGSVTGYSFFKNSRSSVEQQSQISATPLVKVSLSLTPVVKDETVDWIIYRNTKHEFEIEYPRDWKIESENQPVCDFGPSGDSEIICVDEAVNISLSGNMHFYIWKDDCVEDTTWSRQWSLSSVTDPSLQSIDKTVCNKGFTISASLPNSDPKKELYKNIIDYMISSFKLTD